MFKPHITVACVVQCQKQFLMVEETIDGSVCWNQPAGHLEANETLIEAAQRELWEETGLSLIPQSLLKIFQWNSPDNIHFIRFTFIIDLEKKLPTTPHDADIDRCLWLTAEDIISSPQLRSPLVKESIILYQQPTRYPLSLLLAFQWSKP